MNILLANHLSNKLELNLSQKPAKIYDHIGWGFKLSWILSGTLLFLLGLYEMFNVFSGTAENVELVIPHELANDYKPLISPLFFDIIFMIIALGMITAGILAFVTYRNVLFNGKKMIICYRTPLGTRKTYAENIENYEGIRFRAVFYQYGLINRNKYIVELYHKDPRKIVPLYISMSDKDVRKKWKEYARYFKLPTLLNTDKGLIKKELKNLDKSVKELSELGYVCDDFDSYEKLPSSVGYTRKRDKIVLKMKKIIWDAYDIIAWFAIFVASICTIGIAVNFENLRNNFTSTFYSSVFSIIAVIIMAIFILFRKEKLVIKKHKIVNTHKYMLFSTKHCEIMKDKIEDIDIAQNPASGRYFVTISSDETTIAFGAKMAIKDLQWIKKFLIHEVIK